MTGVISAWTERTAYCRYCGVMNPSCVDNDAAQYWLLHHSCAGRPEYVDITDTMINHGFVQFKGDA